MGLFSSTFWTYNPFKSIQEEIEKAISEIIQTPVEIQGAGRTDAGVHALGQVFHFDWNWKHGECKLLQALRSKLPNDISPRSIKPVSSGFHVLRSAKGKCYRYRAAGCSS